MSLKGRFIPFLIVFLLSFPCYYGLQGNPPYDYLDDAYGYDSSRAYEKWPWRKLEVMEVIATEAFKKAWEAACSSQGSVLVVPKNKNYLLKPITFEGPCKSSITVQIYGTVQASADRSAYSNDMTRWLVFENVQNLAVQGWWNHQWKWEDMSCKDAPTALTFYNCKNLVVKNLKIENAQQMHVSFEKCVGVQASGLTVTAPGDSPNTDGIHVTDTPKYPDFKLSDDCISIVSGTQNLQATGITCGPGHGIRIWKLRGSRFRYYSERGNPSGTTNGVRIKTWQGGSGSASNIKFQNIEMHNVKNPIIIDQKYCDQDKPCKSQSRAVQVQNVLYQNIKGTSSSNEAIQLDCSDKFPCQGVVLQDIDIEIGGRATKAVCNNAKVTEKGDVSPSCT
ncbi:Polygalacturonase [Vitis vinifera]|uniref:Polygalacturonase n=1 Tax=Vitis vinifera TaxID=29760 RepID=A0A438EGT1_VITVI|nr:Polygalacturonase [Vitis vinifera]